MLQSTHRQINLLRFALCFSVFFNFIYDILKRYGFNNPEWFWYVGQSVQIMVLFVIIRNVLGKSPLTNLGVYISIGVLFKEVFGNPLEVSLIEYPVILGAYLVDKYIIK